MKPIIAIDPGKSGGIAVETSSGYWCDPMPETFGDVVEYIRETLSNYGDITAYVEAVPKFCGPKLPGSSIFVMAENYGVIQGALMALGIRTILVQPREWQKGLGVGTKAKAGSRSIWKKKLKAEAQRRFPTLKVTEKTADALLILEYARTK